MFNELIFILQICLVVFFALYVKKLGSQALSAWVVIQAVIANIFVVKQIKLFGFEVTASDIFAISSLLGINLIQEHFGKEYAQKTVYSCFTCMIYFLIVSQLHLYFEPSVFDSSQIAFETILGPSLRLILASAVVFFITQKADLYCFSWISRRFTALNFFTRSFISLIFSQFIDTLLFSFLGLYGVVASILDIIIISYIIKLITIFCLTTLSRTVKP